MRKHAYWSFMPFIVFMSVVVFLILDKGSIDAKPYLVSDKETAKLFKKSTHNLQNLIKDALYNNTRQPDSKTIVSLDQSSVESMNLSRDEKYLDTVTLFLRIFPWLIFYRKTALKPAPFLSAWTLFQLSELGKYVPGKIGQFVGIIVLCRFFRIKKAEAIVSMLLQLVLQCASGFLVGAPILFHPSTKSFLHNLFAKVLYNLPLLVGTLLLIVVLCFLLLILLKKHLSTQNIYTLKRIRTLFSLKGILHLTTIYLLVWISLGISFFLFVKSIYPIHVTQFPIIMSIFAFAWSIGFMTLITPGGLGVREGILSLLLTACLPPATATLIALLSRLWIIGVEIILAGVAFGCYFRQKFGLRTI